MQKQKCDISFTTVEGKNVSIKTSILPKINYGYIIPNGKKDNFNNFIADSIEHIVKNGGKCAPVTINKEGENLKSSIYMTDNGKGKSLVIWYGKYAIDIERVPNVVDFNNTTDKNNDITPNINDNIKNNKEDIKNNDDVKIDIIDDKPDDKTDIIENKSDIKLENIADIKLDIIEDKPIDNVKLDIIEDKPIDIIEDKPIDDVKLDIIEDNSIIIKNVKDIEDMNYNTDDKKAVNMSNKLTEYNNCETYDDLKFYDKVHPNIETNIMTDETKQNPHLSNGDECKYIIVGQNITSNGFIYKKKDSCILNIRGDYFNKLPNEIVMEIIILNTTRKSKIDDVEYYPTFGFYCYKVKPNVKGKDVVGLRIFKNSMTAVNFMTKDNIKFT